MQKELGKEVDFQSVKEGLKHHFIRIFDAQITDEAQ